MASCVKVEPVSAQSAVGDWTTPINLSNSGSSLDPAIVVDSDGYTHAIWYDTFDGYKYVGSSDKVEWTPPVVVNFPFQDFRPRLLADSGQFIYAFWQDVTGELYSSRVLSTEFGNGAAWEGALLLAQAALAYDVTLGEDGTIHLAYLRPVDTSDSPAGVYYRQIQNRGSWSSSQSIQTSLYLRGMAVTDAHVSVASGDLAGTERRLRYLGRAPSAPGVPGPVAGWRRELGRTARSRPAQRRDRFHHALRSRRGSLERQPADGLEDWRPAEQLHTPIPGFFGWRPNLDSSCGFNLT